MSYTFSPLSVPSGVRIGFFAALSNKKAGKTTLSRIAANEFTDAGYELVILQHDQHELLGCFAPPTRVELAKAASIIRGKALLDLQTHEPLSEALLSLPEHPRRIVLLDASAPGSERIGAILGAGRFNQLLARKQINALLAVPLRPIRDSALGALAMMEELHTVMPDHFVVPVPICDPDDLALLPADHPFFAVIKAAKHGVIHLPALGEEIAAGLERLERRLSEIADPDSEEALQYIMKTSGHHRLVSGMIAEGAQQLITAFETAMRPLGLAPAE